MDMMTALQQEGGVDAVASQLGVDPATVQSGMGALLPSVLEGLRGTADTHPEGLGGLGSILAGLGGGGLLSNVLGSEPTNVNQGNDILGSIFGSKDGSRAVAADAAQKSGVSSDLLKKMLPLVAMLAAGYLSKHIGANAGAATVPAGAAEPHSDSGGILGSLLGGGSSGGILGSILGGLSNRT